MSKDMTLIVLPLLQIQFMKKIFTLVVLLMASLLSFSQSTTIVISQVYGGGGATSGTPTYINDYVELHNISSVTQSLTGFSIQYGSATGNFAATATNLYAFPAGTSIPAGGYLLIQVGGAGTVGAALPVTPDLITTNLTMSAASGKVALASQATSLACGATATTCTLPSASIIDLVSFGASNNGEGGTTVNNGTALNNTQGAVRKTLGCTETDNNNLDFDVVSAPVPRNSSSAVNLCGAASPTLSATALTAFGNVCINTTPAPNSFTINGTTLTAANVTVGPLAGYTFSTTSGGTYTASLSLPQPGGTYTQAIFVNFTPTAVQSYNGNIPVGGGGATSINVAASGAGVNTAPSVTTGAASAITSVSATLAGSITATGCSAVTAYGIEYSTTNGFPNGTGTQSPSSNLSGGNFSSNVAGLAASTTYYYKAYATNAGGTTYGTQQQFTTAAPSPALSATALTAFGNVCINTTAGPNSFTITGTALTNANVTVGPLTGFTFSTTSGGTYTASLSITQPGGAFSQAIFVNFTPTAVQSYNGNIPVGGGGATSINVAASGSGVNSMASVTTGAASAITTVSATLAGSITATGCSAVTAYGIEYSTTNGFPNGTGTQLPSSNLSGGNFSSNAAGLAPNTTYYYKAYATNAGGTAYGTQQQFTTQSLTPALSATPLAAFGNVCTNTTAGPNSFTISGSALTTANVTVGPLTGYTFSTTSGGTYTASLNLTQPGGTYSQAIFVRFTPTAVQSYDGNIPVGGGGAATINVAASGSGINTAPSVTTGAASAITSISATLAGSIPATGCTAITAYGIEYSTTNGFPNGSGTQVPASNLAAGNFSSNVAGLAPTTTYYYKAYATNAGGTTYGTQQSFTTATPVLTATALTAFGNVCANTTAGPNSFTITGTNLTTANVTVGPLAGFTYSTTSGGTYTTSLSLTQTGGAYSQAIFVRFTPTAVQSYNGNIVVGGGGAANINVAASGAGINTAPSVTTGAASAITQVSATLAGAIPATGCTAITAYGIEYSTTNGFPNGTGIQRPSTNLSGSNFTSALTGLAPSTTYYYKAYATNAGGTTYGTQQQFTTSAPVLTVTALTAFGAVCTNTTAGPNTFTINSTALTTANVNVGPLTGYTFATTANGTYAASLSITQPGGPFSQIIYVKFTPTAIQAYNGNIAVNGGGAPVSTSVAASGSGVNTAPTAVTGNATVLSPNAATLAGSITANGCTAVTAYGIEYYTIQGLANGLGTKVPATNLNGVDFSTTISGLVQGAIYYYKAYATNAGGTSYGAEKTFTTTSIPGGLVIYSNPVNRNGVLHFTLRDIKPGHYAVQIIGSNGQLVHTEDLIVPTTFIDYNMQLPGKLAAGRYALRIGMLNWTVQKSFVIMH
jgi:hypothetical protein